MKRRKQDSTPPRQLCLWDTTPIRQMQTAERKKRRRKPKISPVEALKSSAPTLIPPAGEKAVKTPKNGLKEEILAPDELNRLWKENPEALRTLNQLARKNPAVLSLVRRLALIPLCLCLAFLSSCVRPGSPDDSPKEEIFPWGAEKPYLLEKAVSFLAIAEGWHTPEKTGCTGWGHRCDYDSARATTPLEADSLAASDLRALSARFRDFQGDSLLLALLAYNVGVKAVKTSSLMDSISFDAYVSFCYIKGKRSERQFQRRRAEWLLFKTDEQGPEK